MGDKRYLRGRLQDTTMICAALCSGAARWEPFSDKARGEVCIGGLRYSTELNESGCPVITQPIRAALARAEGQG